MGNLEFVVLVGLGIVLGAVFVNILEYIVNTPARLRNERRKREVAEEMHKHMKRIAAELEAEAKKPTRKPRKAVKKTVKKGTK